MQIIDGFNVNSYIFIENLFDKILLANKISNKYNFKTIFTESDIDNEFALVTKYCTKNIDDFVRWMGIIMTVKRTNPTAYKNNILKGIEQTNGKRIKLKRHIDINEIKDLEALYAQGTMSLQQSRAVYPEINIMEMYSFDKIDKRKKVNIQTQNDMQNYIKQWKDHTITLKDKKRVKNKDGRIVKEQTISNETLKTIKGYDVISDYLYNSTFSLYSDNQKADGSWTWTGLRIKTYNGHDGYVIDKTFKGKTTITHFK